MKRVIYLVLFFWVLVPVSLYAEDIQIMDAFSPNQGASELVVNTIEAAHRNIRIAAYSFTSRPIAEALVRAERRGVQVELLIDAKESRHSLAAYLAGYGINVRTNDRYAIMHDKFMIFDQDVLELGSFNYTKAAETRNAENVFVIKGSSRTLQDYLDQWNKLWAEGSDYRPSR